MELKQGLLHNVPFDEYREIPALNCSALKKMRKSPLHCWTYEHQPQKPPSWQMELGSALDWALFEPEVFEARVVRDLDMNHNKKDYKEWKEEQAAARKIILNEERMDAVTLMAEKLRSKETSRNLLSSGWPQLTLVWYEKDWDLWCKGRVDWVTDQLIVCDLKSARDASYWGFGRQINQLDYGWQAAWYLRGLSVITGVPHVEWRWIVVENEPPYESKVYRPRDGALEEAWLELADYADDYSNCLRNDYWAGYLDEEAEI